MTDGNADVYGDEEDNCYDDAGYDAGGDGYCDSEYASSGTV